MISLTESSLYCNSLTAYKRFKTREVMIGDLALGGDNPIRLQSMTTTDTMDTAATVAQSIRMIEGGGGGGGETNNGTRKTGERKERWWGKGGGGKGGVPGTYSQCISCSYENTLLRKVELKLK